MDNFNNTNNEVNGPINFKSLKSKQSYSDNSSSSNNPIDFKLLKSKQIEEGPNYDTSGYLDPEQQILAQQKQW